MMLSWMWKMRYRQFASVYIDVHAGLAYSCVHVAERLTLLSVHARRNGNALSRKWRRVAASIPVMIVNRMRIV